MQAHRISFAHRQNWHASRSDFTTQLLEHRAIPADFGTLLKS
jgi:hypothetical protein